MDTSLGAKHITTRKVFLYTKLKKIKRYKDTIHIDKESIITLVMLGPT